MVTNSNKFSLPTATLVACNAMADYCIKHRTMLLCPPRFVSKKMHLVTLAMIEVKKKRAEFNKPKPKRTKYTDIYCRMYRCLNPTDKDICKDLVARNCSLKFIQRIMSVFFFKKTINEHEEFELLLRMYSHSPDRQQYIRSKVIKVEPEPPKAGY